jgi:hypothetical protein
MPIAAVLTADMGQKVAARGLRSEQCRRITQALASWPLRGQFLWSVEKFYDCRKFLRQAAT